MPRMCSGTSLTRRNDNELSTPGAITLFFRSIPAMQAFATRSGDTDNAFPIKPCLFMREMISALVGIGPRTAKLTEMPSG